MESWISELGDTDRTEPEILDKLLYCIAKSILGSLETEVGFLNTANAKVFRECHDLAVKSMYLSWTRSELGSSVHSQQLTIASNSGSEGPDTLFWPL